MRRGPPQRAERAEGTIRAAIPAARAQAGKDAFRRRDGGAPVRAGLRTLVNVG